MGLLRVSAWRTPTLLSLIQYNGDVYAISDVGVRRWTGSVWQLIPGISSAYSATVADLGSGPTLFIGGNNTASFYGVFAWNGATTTPFGTPIGSTSSATPRAIVAFEHALVIATYSLPGSLARWDGAAWQPLGAGINAGDVALISFDDGEGPALYACGPITSAGGSPARGLVKWRNNLWSPVVPATGSRPLSQPAMAVFQNRLYIAGDFTEIGGVVGDHLIVVDPCAPTCTADFNNDGDSGTDADIEAFFACLAGSCCASCASADFNNDGDSGTDADIESFFRVLAGGPC